MGQQKVGGYLEGVKKRTLKTYKKHTKGWTALDKANFALKTALALKYIINAEKKFYDNQQNRAMSWNAVVDQLSGIPQGDGPQQRDGNSVLLRGVLIRGRINLNASNSQSTVRLMVIRDTDPMPSAVPTGAEILQSTGDGYAPLQKINDDNRNRFKVLKTMMLNLNSVATNTMPFKIYIPFKGKTHARFNGSLGTALRGGHIYFVMVSDDDGTTAPNYCLYSSRVYYYDN